MNQPRRYIWSEYVPYQTLCERRVLDALASREIRLMVAVTPDVIADRPDIADVIAACRDADVFIGVWPMIDNQHGRWPSAANAERFCAFAARLFDSLDARGALPDELAIDLEPPIGATRSLLRGRWQSLTRERDATERYRALIARLSARGVLVSAAVVPLCVLDARGASRGWQRLLGIPVDDLPFDRLSIMAYTSLLQGYSRGAVRRADAISLLARLTALTRDKYGDRASVSLGAIGIGALGDESTYRSPDELAEDVAVARAAGIQDMALFNLGGALDRPPLEAWLDAFALSPPAPALPPITLRTRVFTRALSLLGYLGYLR